MTGHWRGPERDASLPQSETTNFELFKFQRPADGHVLIHNEDSNFWIEASFDENWAELFGENLKFYAYAHYDPVTNKFTFDRSRQFITDAAKSPEP